VNEYALATLYDLKAFLGIAQTDTTNDRFLERMIATASGMTENHLNRKIRARDYTEYHNGGRRYIFVNNPPINSVTSVYDDPNREWDSGTLLDSDYYHFDGDFAEQGRIDFFGYESLGNGVANVRVIYNGGFDEFVVTAGENDYIDWYDEDGGTLIQTDLTAGTYTGATLAAHIAAAMTAEASGDTITCTYNAVTGKFTIASDRADHSYFSLAWQSGTNTAKTSGTLLGYDVSADTANAASHTGAYAVLGIPQEIQEYAGILAAILYKQSFAKGGDGRLGISARNVGVTASGTTYENLATLLENARVLVSPYRRVNV